MQVFCVNRLNIILACLVLSNLFLIDVARVSASSSQVSKYMGTWSGSLSVLWVNNFGEWLEGENYRPAQTYTYKYAIEFRINVRENGSFTGETWVKITETSFVIRQANITSSFMTVDPASFTAPVRGTIWPKTSNTIPPIISWDILRPELTQTTTLVSKDGEVTSSTTSWDKLIGYADHIDQEDGVTMILAYSYYKTFEDNFTHDEVGEGKLVRDTTGLAPAKVSAVQGDVKIWRYWQGLPMISSRLEPLEQGMSVYAGDIILAGFDGQAVVSLPDGSGLKIRKNSQTQLLGLEWTTKLKLLFGKIWFNVKSTFEALRSRTKFEVLTPIAIIGVRGTEFVTEVSEDNTTAIIVLDGTVDVSDLQQVKNVTVCQDQMSTCQPGGVPSDPSPFNASHIEWWWEEKIETPFLVNLGISGLPSVCSTNVFVDGTFYDRIAGNESLTLEFTATSKMICVDQCIDGLSGTRHLCASYSWIASSADSKTFDYATQYMLFVGSTYGSAQGEGWYDSGSTATFSVSPRTIDYGNQTRLQFIRWTEGSTSTEPNSSMLMDGPKMVNALWETQYYLTVMCDRGEPQGSGWYGEGSTATFSVNSPIPTEGILGVLGVRNVFDVWTGNSTATSANASLVMDSPKTVTANWITDYTMLYLIDTGIVAAAAAPLLAVFVRRRRRKAPSSSPPEVALTAESTRANMRVIIKWSN